MPNKDGVIPIAFPDYLISVPTPRVDLQLPDVLPGVDILPDAIRIPAMNNKLPELGHAGVMFYRGSDGMSKYYEYGRYDKQQLGLTRRVSIPNLTISKDGRPTVDSLKAALHTISRKAGQGGRISGAYIELGSGAYQKMLDYALSRMAENADAGRAPYTLWGNSCNHFMIWTAEAGGADMPFAYAPPNPKLYMEVVQYWFPDLDYDPKGSKLALEGVPLT